MRIVLDTNILVRANPTVLPQGLARDLLLTILSGPHVLVLSAPLLTEVQQVLNYPHVQARWPLTPDAIAQYVFLLQDAGAMIDLPESFPAVVSDPDDDFVLQTAIAGQAEVLCTRDTAFRHEKVEEVCAAHGIRILEDITLLQELRQARKA
ncbi:MAG: putative toxin-antitoxin system toxin component, PIN family [Bryobacteraceae bacterium]